MRLLGLFGLFELFELKGFIPPGAPFPHTRQKRGPCSVPELFEGGDLT